MRKEHLGKGNSCSTVLPPTLLQVCRNLEYYTLPYTLCLHICTIFPCAQSQPQRGTWIKGSKVKASVVCVPFSFILRLELLTGTADSSPSFSVDLFDATAKIQLLSSASLLLLLPTTAPELSSSTVNGCVTYFIFNLSTENPK